MRSPCRVVIARLIEDTLHCHAERTAIAWLCASSAVGRNGVRCASCVARQRRRRLFVADRNSNKVTVYDSDGGKTLDIDVKVMAAPQRIMNGVLV